MWQATSLPILPTNGFWPGFSETAIQDFLTGKTPEPAANRPLNTTGAQEAKTRINAFVEQAEAVSESDYACKLVYLDFERERLAMFSLIAEPGDAANQNRLNDEVYGQLKDMHHTAAVAHLAQHVAALEPAGSGAAAAITAVLAEWPHIKPDNTMAADFEKLNRYRIGLRPYVAAHFGYVDELLAPHEDSGSLSSSDLAAVLDQTVGRVLGDDRRGWRASTAEGVPNVFVNLHERAVTVPAGRTFSIEHAKTLAVHEIGVHVRRAYNGAASLEPLAGIGMPGYGPTEEAFGVLLGNAPKSTYHQINSLIPFAVIDYAGRSDAPTFRQVHEFAMNLIIALANPDEAELAKRRPEFARAAFSRTIRVLRLGKPGLIDRSTTKYWYGQLLIGTYFDQHGLDEQAIETFLLGKYNCLDPRQLPLIQSHTTGH